MFSRSGIVYKAVTIQIAYTSLDIYCVRACVHAPSRVNFCSNNCFTRISHHVSERRFGHRYVEHKQKKPQRLNVGLHLSRQFATQQDAETRTYKTYFSTVSILISTYLLVLLHCFILIKDFLLV